MDSIEGKLMKNENQEERRLRLCSEIEQGETYEWLEKLWGDLVSQMVKETNGDQWQLLKDYVEKRRASGQELNIFTMLTLIPKNIADKRQNLIIKMLLDTIDINRQWEALGYYVIECCDNDIPIENEQVKQLIPNSMDANILSGVQARDNRDFEVAANKEEYDFMNSLRQRLVPSVAIHNMLKPLRKKTSCMEGSAGSDKKIRQTYDDETKKLPMPVPPIITQNRHSSLMKLTQVRKDRGSAVSFHSTIITMSPPTEPSERLEEDANISTVDASNILNQECEEGEIKERLSAKLTTLEANRNKGLHLISWTLSPNLSLMQDQIRSFLIYVNGEIHHKVRNPLRRKAILGNLGSTKAVISLYAELHDGDKILINKTTILKR